MEETLFKGIYTKYNGDTTGLKTTLSNGLYPGRAPQATTEPYGTYTLISDVTDEGFDFVIDEALIQFDFYSASRSPTSITRIAKDAKKLFDWATISTTGSTAEFTHVSMSRELSYLLPVGVGEEEKWRYMVQFWFQWYSTGNKP